MRRVWFWSFAAGLGSLLGSVIIINTLMPLMGQEIVSSMYWASVIGSFGIGSPVTYYCLRQNYRLNQALRYLAEVEAQLRQANARLRSLSHETVDKDDLPLEENVAVVNGVQVR